MNEWKYIVYETTNLVNNKIYIGLHKTKDPDVFDGYLGNGVYATLPYTYKHSKTAFLFAVNKYGPKNFRRKTLAVFDTIEEASELEEKLVNEKFLERNDVYNMVLGDDVINESEVSLYDVKGGVIQTFKTLNKCAKYLSSSIHTVKKYAIQGNCFRNSYYLCFVEAENYSIARTDYIKNRKVYKYNSDGSFCKEYDTQTEAELENKVNITKAIRLKTPDENGYIWGLEKLENYNKPSKPKEKRKVGKYDLKGNLVKEYDSATAAAKENGTSVWKVLAGTNKTHKLHIYKHLT